MRIINTTVQNNPPIEHDFPIEDNSSLSETVNELGAEFRELNEGFEEFKLEQKNRSCTIENSIKDTNQRISALEKLLEKLNETLSRSSIASSNLPVKNNIFFNFTSASSNVVTRIEGFQGATEMFTKGGGRIVLDVPIRGRYAQLNRDTVLIEFASPFPKKFSLHIEASTNCGYGTKPLGKYKVYIGSFGKEKLHEEEFELSEANSEQCASLLFDTEEQDNNIISIIIPKLDYRNAGLHLYSLNIIPR